MPLQDKTFLFLCLCSLQYRIGFLLDRELWGEIIIPFIPECVFLRKYYSAAICVGQKHFHKSVIIIGIFFNFFALVPLSICGCLVLCVVMCYDPYIYDPYVAMWLCVVMCFDPYICGCWSILHSFPPLPGRSRLSPKIADIFTFANVF